MRGLLLFIVLGMASVCLAEKVLQGYVWGVEGTLPMVNVVDEEANRWTYTDNKGFFKIKVGNKFRIRFSILGKEDFVLEDVGVGNLKEIKIFLKDKNLRLSEVVVTASPQKKSMGSAILFDKYAISQIQAFSLGDVLLQLPNQKIESPDLHSPNILHLRTAINSQNNAFGVSYIIDGMPISNDENMQVYGYGSDGRMIKTTRFSSVNLGVDLRSIPVSNIAKIEVVTGIPEAKYGNTTTALVLVKQQAGVYPLQVNAKMLGGGNAISVAKGFKLSKNKGNLSLSLDYLNANADPRNNLASYGRVTTSGIWSIWSKKGLYNTLNLRVQSNIDGEKEDKEFKQGYRNTKRKREYGFTFNNRMSYQLNYKFIDEVNATVGIAYTHSQDREEKFINRGGEVVPTAMTTMLHEGLYTPVSFISKRETNGMPVRFTTTLACHKNIARGVFNNSLSCGVDFTYSDNWGKGIVFDAESANTIGTISNISNAQQGVRPLNFNKYVIASKLFSCYVQDNFSWQIDEQKALKTNVGMRYDNQNGFSTLSPRLNMIFEISPKVKFRAGWGLATKSPSLVNMFPGNVYFDILLKDLRTNEYALNLVQTFVEQRPKVHLKPSKIWKYEIGTDISFGIADLTITAYWNNTFDGFVNEPIFKKYTLPVLEFSKKTPIGELPQYKIIGEESIIKSYSSTKNAQKYTDKGIEFMLRFHKIQSIHTQFSLQGSYVYSQSVTELPYIQKANNELQKEYVYGFYKQIPEKQDKMSLRLTATHHWEELGLLVSLMAEQFVFATHYASVKERYPYAYMNNELEYIKIKQGDVQNDKYADLFLSQSLTDDVKTPLYHNFHLRITKEMLSGLSISLYANNFLDYHPKVRINKQTHYKNSKISFGGNIRYLF